MSLAPFHLLVTIDPTIVASVLSFNALWVDDTVGGCQVLAKASKKHKTIKAFSGDQGYQGTAVVFVKNELGLSLTISAKKEGGFTVLPKRWIVERTFAWLGHFRRLSKDFEILTSTAETVIRLAMLKITIAKCL